MSIEEVRPIGAAADQSMHLIRDPYGKPRLMQWMVEEGGDGAWFDMRSGVGGNPDQFWKTGFRYLCPFDPDDVARAHAARQAARAAAIADPCDDESLASNMRDAAWIYDAYEVEKLLYQGADRIEQLAAGAPATVPTPYPPRELRQNLESGIRYRIVARGFVEGNLARIVVYQPVMSISDEVYVMAEARFDADFGPVAEDTSNGAA